MIISRKEAKAKGHKRYYTGKECSNGHIAERFVSNCRCIKCSMEKAQEWREENRNRVREYSRQYYGKNTEQQRETSRRCYANSKERVRENHRKWCKENSHKRAENQMRREARKKSQVCDCCKRDEVQQVYADAKMAGCEVDHITPLALGGKHCRKNLQLLTAREHLEKTRKDRREIANSARNQAARQGR